MAAARILFTGGGTGGHLYPALNVARAIQRAEPAAECFFLGSERGIEARVLPRTEFAHRLLPMQPFYRSRPLRNWKVLWTAPRVMSGVRRSMKEFDPQVVVGTGGYVSGPAVLWASAGRRWTAIQEQNARPGMVTRLLAGRVNHLYLGYPEARHRLDLPERVQVFEFGNPVSMAPPRTPFAWPGPPVLLVVGGSQGARGINERLTRDLEEAAEREAAGAEPGPCARQGPGGMSPAARSPSPPRPEGLWPEGLSLVWIAGADHATPIADRVARLPWADRIHVVPFVDDLGGQLGRATLVLARAGAMFIAEMCAAGVPALLVPLPTAADDHQTANARALEAAGAARALVERDLAPGELWSACRGLLADPERRHAMADAARARARPDAANRIALELLGLAGRARG